MPGALHESFPTEQEAIDVFERERDNGNTKIVGGIRSKTVHSGSQEVRAPLAPSVNSFSDGSSPLEQLRASPSASRTSLLQMPTPSHGATYDTTPPRTRSVSPPIVHPNVSYTRGASSPRRGNHRQASPRVVVHTPTELNSYPSDDESLSASHRMPQTPILQSPPLSHFHTMSVRELPRTPPMLKRSPTHPAIVVETPSRLQSYPSDHESMSSSTPAPMTSSILSPLSSPPFFTPEVSSPQAPMLSRRSSGAPSSTPRYQLSHPARSASCRSPHPHQEAILQPLVYIISPSPGNHSQCQHTCPHCKITSMYTSGELTPVQLLQPMHVQHVVHDPVHDPRSPMIKNTTLPNHAKFVSCLLCLSLATNDIVVTALHHSVDHHLQRKLKTK